MIGPMTDSKTYLSFINQNVFYVQTQRELCNSWRQE